MEKLSRMMTDSGVCLSEFCLPPLNFSKHVFNGWRSLVRACFQCSFEVENIICIVSKLVRNKSEVYSIKRSVLLLCGRHCLTDKFMSVTKWNAFSDKVVSEICGKELRVLGRFAAILDMKIHRGNHLSIDFKSQSERLYGVKERLLILLQVPIVSEG